MRVAGAFEIAGQRHQLGARPGAAMRLGHRLVAIADAIDEPRRLGLLGEERPAIDQRLHLALGEMPGLGDAAGDLAGNRAEQALDLLALRRCHLGLGQEVRGALVLLAAREAGFDPEAVERAAQERHLGVQADQSDSAQRLEPDFIEGRGEVIGSGAAAELAKAFGKGDGEFALAAEGGDRVAHLLDLREAERIAVDMGVEPFDPRILAGAFERVEKAAQCRFAADHQLGERVLAPFHQAAAKIRRQDHTAGEGGLARRDAPHRDPGADNHERDNDADNGK